LIVSLQCPTTPKLLFVFPPTTSLFIILKRIVCWLKTSSRVYLRFQTWRNNTTLRKRELVDIIVSVMKWNAALRIHSP
jgi:hypothetical protein